MEEFSRVVSRTLDNIGYSKEVVRLRRRFRRDVVGLWNQLHGVHFIAAGSKAEGITSVCESDFDTMILLNDVICTDNIEPFLQLLATGVTIFKVDTENVSPGYSKLKLIGHRDRMQSEIQESLFKEVSWDTYASSTLFASECNRRFRSDFPYSCIHDLSGPSSPQTIEMLSFDNVYAFRCVSLTILRSFQTRQRQYDWPPAQIIHDESSAVCQLVPVGCKGSYEQWKEWRFCFIETELKLTQSLNDIQLKLYILLKMVAKNILKKLSNEISSYVMKNITFWMSEWFGTHIFREENLLKLLLMSLKFLKFSIAHYCLPYFMIPARNLLAERLEPQTRHRLCDVVTELLDEGPLLLHRCEKLHTGLTVMYMSPELIVQYRNTKETVELLCFLLEYNAVLAVNGLHDGQVLKKLVTKLADILLPEWRLYRRCGVNFVPSYVKRLRNILS